MPLFLGLDLGSTNAKAALYDAQGGLVGEQAVAYPTDFSRPGGAEQRLSDWTDALTHACRQVMNQAGALADEVVAMGLSAHGPGVILLDDAGEAVLPTSPTWQDTRAVAEGDRLLTQQGRAWTGLGIARNSFPAKLKWTIEHFPAQAAQARYALGIKEYLTYWLTGALITEPTQVAGGLNWDAALMAAAGWTVDRLAPVAPATQIAGDVRAGLVDQLGLPRAIPVVSGLADGAAATLSMGAIQPGQAVMTLATSGVMRVVMDQPVQPALQVAHDLFCWPYVEAGWIAGGHIKAAASALHWLQGALTSAVGAPSFAELLAAAAQAPSGSRGVTFLPYLLGRGSPHADETATGAFLGLTLRHNQSDLTRAVLEGVACAYRDVLDDFTALGYVIPELRISGGGAASPLWRQILADLLQRPLIYYQADSTLGAAMTAAVGIEYYTNFTAAIAAMVQPGVKTAPAVASGAAYAPVLQVYREWRDRLYQNKP